jgi:hypothetical protein
MEISPQPAKQEVDPAAPMSPDGPSGAGGQSDRSARFGWIDQASSFLHRKENMLWWLHSAYALLFGLGVMWLGSRNFNYIRFVVLYISFIWLTSLFLPVLVNRDWISPAWRERIRLVINYFNRNFYQQLLFFLLPIYYSSTTFGSRNMWFLGLLAASAVVSTMDIVYDRYLSVRWQLTTLFFMFNLFASINVMLPVVWSVSHRWALWISAVLAYCGFASMLYRLSGLHGRTAKRLLVMAAVGLFLLIEIFQPFIPPAPLTLTSAEFGTSVKSLEIINPIDTLPSGPGKIALMTSIKAPLGLEEGVRHRWLLDGKVLFESRFFPVTGGRKDGYRLWTQIAWRKEFIGRELIVDIEIQGGQLIGRAKLKK